MSYTLIGRRYAKGLFAIIKEKNAVQTYLYFFRTLEDTLQENSSLISLLHNPRISKKDKKALVEKVLSKFQAPTDFANCVQLMLKMNRALAIPAFFQECLNMLQGSLNLYPAKCYTATAVDQEALQAFIAKLSEKKKKQYLVSHHQDPKILGGIVFNDGTTQYDLSYVTQLKLLKQQILEEF